MTLFTQISVDLLKLLLVELVTKERRLYSEFSGDFDGSEKALWNDPLLVEGLATLGVTATALRDEINLQFDAVGSCEIDPERYIPLE